MKYVYVGWGPDVAPEGEIVRPGDEREFAEQPTWGRWAAVADPPEAAEGEKPGPPEASPAALSAAPALNLVPDAPKGM